MAETKSKTAADEKQAPVAPDTAFDPSHPAVAADPREKAPEVQSRIDFNDPHLSGSEAVEKSLGLRKQGE